MRNPDHRASGSRRSGGLRIALYAILVLVGISAALILQGVARSHLARSRSPATAPAQASGPAPARRSSTSAPNDSPSPDTTPAPSRKKTPPGFHLVLSESFSGQYLDPTWWQVYDSRGNAGVGLRRPSQVNVTHGMLQITADGTTSGGIDMNYSQVYGLYEFRARTEVSRGSWSNILLWPEGGYPAYAKAGEMDIAEFSDGSSSRAFLHYAGRRQIALHFPGNFQRWHTWDFEWLPRSLTLWIDGKEVYRAPAHVARRYRQPMVLAIQLDILRPPNGPRHGQVSRFDVDWIRVYARTPHG